MSIILEFGGWCLIRLATDPDPSDEPRGVSGYTFALAGEPDLDRVVRFQPPPDSVFALRSHSPAVGVTVTRVTRDDSGAELPGIAGAPVELLGEPRLENRQWALTLPGYEPIVPFHLRIITSTGLSIERSTPLNPADPGQPVWKAPAAVLAEHGAQGISCAPELIRQATGLDDPLTEVIRRLGALQEELDAGEVDATGRTALDARISELQYAVDNPTDRRVGMREFIEQFAFELEGPVEVTDGHGLLGGTPDTDARWPITFWIGGWDPDALCAYVKGSLTIPYATGAAPPPATSTAGA